MDNLLRIFYEVMSQQGFIKKGSSCYKLEDEIIKVVDLQKSQYSNSYYVNICVFFKSLESLNGWPKEEKCHVRTRLNNIMIGIDEKFDYLFDEDCKIDVIDFKKKINECIRRNILPQLEFISDKEKIRNYAKLNNAFLNMLPLKVKTYLQLK